MEVHEILGHWDLSTGRLGSGMDCCWSQLRGLDTIVSLVDYWGDSSSPLTQSFPRKTFKLKLSGETRLLEGTQTKSKWVMQKQTISKISERKINIPEGSECWNWPFQHLSIGHRASRISRFTEAWESNLPALKRPNDSRRHESSAQCSLH